jgi:hypothetical protein
VMYAGVNPNSGETVHNLEREIERLWNAFKKRYGEKTARKRDNPLGIELSWDYEKARISMLRSTLPKKALFLEYKPPQP